MPRIKKVKKISSDKIKIAEEFLKEIFDLTELEVKFEVSESETGEITVQIESSESGLLIGYHGQNLQALQHLLNLMVFRKTGEWPKIVVNVGDYWQKRKEVLEAMARSIAQKVRFSGEEQALAPMSSAERRIVHLCLAEDSELETVSEGEGRERKVVIRIRK